MRGSTSGRRSALMPAAALVCVLIDAGPLRRDGRGAGVPVPADALGRATGSRRTSAGNSAGASSTSRRRRSLAIGAGRGPGLVLGGRSASVLGGLSAGCSAPRGGTCRPPDRWGAIAGVARGGRLPDGAGLPTQTWVLAAADSYAHYATLPVGLLMLAGLVELGERSLPGRWPGSRRGRDEVIVVAERPEVARAGRGDVASARRPEMPVRLTGANARGCNAWDGPARRGGRGDSPAPAAEATRRPIPRAAGPRPVRPGRLARRSDPIDPLRPQLDNSERPRLVARPLSTRVPADDPIDRARPGTRPRMRRRPTDPPFRRETAHVRRNGSDRPDRQPPEPGGLPEEALARLVRRLPRHRPRGHQGHADRLPARLRHDPRATGPRRSSSTRRSYVRYRFFDDPENGGARTPSSASTGR